MLYKKKKCDHWQIQWALLNSASKYAEDLAQLRGPFNMGPAQFGLKIVEKLGPVKRDARNQT